MRSRELCGGEHNSCVYLSNKIRRLCANPPLYNINQKPLYIPQVNNNLWLYFQRLKEAFWPLRCRFPYYLRRAKPRQKNFRIKIIPLMAI